METIMTKEQKLLTAVKSIPAIADKEQWVLTLDKEEGTLFYSPECIPDGAELHQVTDEYALYVDKDFIPKGVMIEYFNVNFVKHHNLFESLSKEVFAGEETVKVVDAKSQEKNKDASFLKTLLEKTLILEADSQMLPA
jgi:hypothetical protein